MASLRVKDQGGGPIFYGRWRDGDRVVERPIGTGWLVREGERGGKPNGKAVGKWRERSGKVPAHCFNIQSATQQLPAVEECWRRAQEAPHAEEAAAASMTVRELADRYLEWGARDDPHTDREGWKHSHATNVRAYVGRLARELGEDQAIRDLTHADIVALMGQLVPARRGKPTGSRPTRGFLRQYALPLKGMFALALREGWVDEDVAAGLPSYKPKRKRAADPMRRDEYLTPEEVAGVLSFLLDEQNRAMVTVMAMGGLRPGEMLALRWQDVDLAGSSLRIVESRTMGLTGTPKSGSGRSLPMTPGDGAGDREGRAAGRADQAGRPRVRRQACRSRRHRCPPCAVQRGAGRGGRGAAP